MSKNSDRVAAERLKTEAQTLANAGRLTAALEAYGRAVEALPTDAWLHHAAGELAKKLKQDELAATYFRKAGAAFRANGFNRYALPALRSSWILLRSGLPANTSTYIDVTHELAAIQRELGFETDAAKTEALGNAAFESQPPAVPSDRSPPRESLARALEPRVASSPAVAPGFRRWLERIRKALSA